MGTNGRHGLRTAEPFGFVAFKIFIDTELIYHVVLEPFGF